MMRNGRRWRFGASFLVLAGLLGGTIARGTEPAGTLKALQGTWKTGEAEGQGLGTWTFEGSTLKVAFPAMNYVAEVTVEETGALARIDCKIVEGQAEAVGETVLGLVAVEGSRATLCIAAPGSPRPTSMEPEDGVFRFTLTRRLD